MAWHIANAQRTYDCLCDIAALKFDHAQKIDLLVTVMDNWIDHTSTRPDHFHDPGWCCVGSPNVALGELKARVLRVLDTTLCDASQTTSATVRQILQVARVPEEIRANPHPDSADILHSLLKSIPAVRTNQILGTSGTSSAAV